jgi:hypothetical protein
MYSCKDDIKPGNYTLGQPSTDTTTWQWQYTYSGVLPNWGSGSINNELVGTKWVLTYLQIGFSTPPLPIDTIRFVSNVNYTINNDGITRTYQLSNGLIVSSKTLTLNNHYPFGSGNYSGQVSSTFVTEGVILNCEFVNINTTTTTVRASFLRLL